MTVALDTGSDYAFTLGERTDRSGNHAFSGAIDEVYVYSSALDAASIQVLYDAVTPQPTVTPLPTHVSHSTLVAHYRFDKVLATEDGDRSLPFLVRLSPTRATVRVLFVRAPPARVAY